MGVQSAARRPWSGLGMGAAQPNLSHTQAETQKSLVSRNIQGQHAGAEFK